jgi:hypothetical protein
VIFFFLEGALRNRERGGPGGFWCWISASPTTVSEVALTLVLTDTYITLMISMNH